MFVWDRCSCAAAISSSFLNRAEKRKLIGMLLGSCMGALLLCIELYNTVFGRSSKWILARSLGSDRRHAVGQACGLITRRQSQAVGSRQPAPPVTRDWW